jgi:hypothetical protein
MTIFTRMPSLPDVPRMADPGLYELLQAMRRVTLGNAAAIVEAATGAAPGVATGDGTGERDPPSLVLDYDAVPSADATAALEAYHGDPLADDVYTRKGTYTTSRTRENFTKHYAGRGQYVLPDRVAPPNFGFVKDKPETAPVQGFLGWFAGDQKFTDGGEWKVIGPNLRTYDVAARYFESNLIPHHAWFDVESGNSGIQGYITGGVTPGTTVTILGKADPEWVGKVCQIKRTFGGEVLSGDLTVASVLNNTVTFTTAHNVTLAWNVAAGNAPNISFAPRTWAGMHYILARAYGGGDIYGHIVRMQVHAQPKISELVHAFNGTTGGQYGGSVDFTGMATALTVAWNTGQTVATVSPMSDQMQLYIPGKRAMIRAWRGGVPLTLVKVISCTATTITFADPAAINHAIGCEVSIDATGTYATGWENQYNDNGSDVAVIAQVDSFVRENDRADGGGRAWLGTRFVASTRPSDAAHVVAGRWRRGLDTVTAAMVDGSYLLDPTLTSSVGINVKWPSGARVGHPIQIVSGVQVYNGLITAVNGSLISVSPAVGFAFPANSRVDFLTGGAAIAMTLGQGINWNATADPNGRSGDPLQVWGPQYGNKTGNIWTETGNEGGSDFWQTLVGDARIRLRPTSFNVSVIIQSATAIVAGEDLVTNGSSINGSWQGAVVFGQGLGEQIVFNPVTNKYEFYINSAVVFTIP